MASPKKKPTQPVPSPVVDERALLMQLLATQEEETDAAAAELLDRCETLQRTLATVIHRVRTGRAHALGSSGECTAPAQEIDRACTTLVERMRAAERIKRVLEAMPVKGGDHG